VASSWRRACASFFDRSPPAGVGQPVVQELFEITTF
jgi:hypothetical protein